MVQELQLNLLVQHVEAKELNMEQFVKYLTYQKELIAELIYELEKKVIHN